MPDPVVIVGILACFGAFLLGSHPTISEGVRKQHVWDNPRIFPKQYNKLVDDKD